MVNRESLDRIARSLHRARTTIEQMIGMPELPEDSTRRKHIRDANADWLVDLPYRMVVYDPLWRVTVDRIIREHARNTLPQVQFDRVRDATSNYKERLYEIAGAIQVEPSVETLWQSSLFVERPGRAYFEIPECSNPIALYHTHPIGPDTPSEQDCRTFATIAHELGTDAVRFGILSTQFDSIGWYGMVKRKQRTS